MPVTFKQSQAIAKIAALLYSFLPGSGDERWRGHVSFKTVARDTGVGDFWLGGSKQPSIARLLEETLDKRPDHFQPLILAVVRNGLAYRQKNGRLVSRGEIEELNQLVVQVGFKFPELWAKDFLESLPDDVDSTGTQPAERFQRAGTPLKPSQAARSEMLLTMRDLYYSLATSSDRQAAGIALEGLLNDLFRLFGLEPRSPFRIQGEQIDGSFILDHETYLVEAKWVSECVPEADLLVFKGKIEGKSAFTRGVFVSINGFSPPAIEAFTKGKQPRFFLVQGHDLSVVLEGQVELPELLRFKLRKLTEEGLVFVSVRELIG